MRNEDVELGMKVRPSQTTKASGDLETSANWMEARRRNQPFLYVISCRNSSQWVLGVSSNQNHTYDLSYYNSCDFEPFEKNTIAEDIIKNEKKTIDGRRQINKDLWKLFLKNLICIQCETEQEAIKLLLYCKKQGIKWNSRVVINPSYNHWQAFKSDTCYSLDAVGLEYTTKFNYLPNEIVNYNKVFDNTNDNPLSQLTNEELLNELKLRLNKDR